jgi:glycosyltransferase involved in cell wall biosynthesis
VIYFDLFNYFVSRFCLKKVLFVDHDFGFSGATVSLKYIVNFFIESSISVFVLTPKSVSDQTCFTSVGATCISSSLFNHDFLRLGLHFTDKRPVTTLKGMIFLGKELARIFLGIVLVCSAIIKIKPDLVYVNEYVSLQASIAGKLLGKATAVHIRSPFVHGTFGIRGMLLANAVVAFNDVVFAITEYESKQIRRRAYKSGNVMVVHEFLDKEDFRTRICSEADRSQLKLPLDKKIITMFGGIYPIKGTLDFLLSAEIVLSRQDNVFFAIAGKEYVVDPAYYHECKRVAAQPHLQKHIVSLGEIDRKTDLIGCCTALVSSNIETHFSRPIIEAWAQKKPVVATDTEHNLNLVENEINGLIVETGNHEKMAAAVLRLVNDDVFAERLGANGYKKARTQFNAIENTKKIFLTCQGLMRQG